MNGTPRSIHARIQKAAPFLPPCLHPKLHLKQCANPNSFHLLHLCTWPDLDEGEGGTGEDALVRALRRAVEAGDTDLVYLVLFTAYRSRSLQVRPQAHHLLPYCV